jgi:hypothetical protein
MGTPVFRGKEAQNYWELLVSDKNKEQSSENAKLLMYRPNDSGETAIKKSKPHTQNSNSN